jgi:hypothetical protein
VALRGNLKHGAGHTGRHRRTTHHRHVSAEGRAALSAARVGHPHPHKGSHAKRHGHPHLHRKRTS